MADMISTNRKVLDETLYRVKKLEYGNAVREREAEEKEL